MEQISVSWQGKQIQFPYRIYTEVSKSNVLTTHSLDTLSLYTRHHNGHIREIAILTLMNEFPTESIPFVVQLLGELH